MTSGGERYEVPRAGSRTVLKWVILPLMLVAFGAFFLFLLSPAGATSLGAFERIVALLFCGVALLLIGGGLIGEFRRGRGPALAIDAAGMRIAGMPWLAWADIAEVRSEEIVGFGSNEHDEDSETSVELGGALRIGVDRRRTIAEARASATAYRRLGVVPRDSRLRGQFGGPFAVLTRATLRMRQKSLERMGGKAIELAPYGVYDYELGAPFAEVIARVSAFHPVVEVSDLAGFRT